MYLCILGKSSWIFGHSIINLMQSIQLGRYSVNLISEYHHFYCTQPCLYISKLNIFTDKYIWYNFSILTSCSQLYSLLIVKMKNGPKMIKFISEADYGVSNWEPQAAAQMVHHQIVAERLSLPAVVIMLWELNSPNIFLQSKQINYLPLL